MIRVTSIRTDRSRRAFLALAALVATGAAACSGSRATASAPASSSSGGGGMKIESSAFSHQGEIPPRYTCEGSDASPPLAWSGVPNGTRSLALIVDDPDAPDPAAPQRTWVHWVVYDMPPTTQGLAEAARPPAGARVGLNDWRKASYGGPCPPIGRHRYFHKLYALDREIGDLGPAAGKGELEKAMAGHVLASAELVGIYKKKG